MVREQFVTIINAIEKKVSRDKEIYELFSKIFTEAYPENLRIENDILLDAVVKYLVDTFKDKDEWISYFLWETNFGKESYRLQAYYKDGSVIPLSNAGELYDLLIKNMEEK